MIPENYLNKFEIPLTMNDTEKVFEVLDDSKYNKFIKDVYMPCHIDDSPSGRMFMYKRIKEDYYDLIKKISVYKKVTITYPTESPSLDVMIKYVELGASAFMVREWNDMFIELKEQFPNVEICRSICGNSFNEEIDERFDQIVIPYHKMLDLQWIKDNYQKSKLVAISNHSCGAECDGKDYCVDIFMKSNPEIKEQYIGCQYRKSGDRFINTSLPKQVMDILNPYIYKFKLVERTSTIDRYKKFLDYCFYERMVGYNIMEKEENFETSNLKNMNCEFKCSECTNKCIKL